MTGSVGIVGLSTQRAPQPAAAAGDASSESAATSTKLAVSNSSTPISPRIVVDPQAGVITQFLGANGELESQIPSAAVVAYLKAGLTRDGYAKPTPESEQIHKKSGTNTSSIVA